MLNKFYKLFFLSVIFFLLRIIFSVILQTVFSLPIPEVGNKIALVLFNYLVALVLTIITYPILRSSTVSVGKTRLTLASVLILIPIIINQIEAFFFKGSVDNISTEELLVYSLANIIAAIVFIFIYSSMIKPELIKNITKVRINYNE